MSKACARVAPRFARPRREPLPLWAGMEAQIKAVHRTMRCLHPSHSGVNTKLCGVTDPVGVDPTWEAVRPRVILKDMRSGML